MDALTLIGGTSRGDRTFEGIVEQTPNPKPQTPALPNSHPREMKWGCR